MIDDEEYYDSDHARCAEVIDRAEEFVTEKLARIRLGVYSEEQDGTLQEILEEIERILR